MMTERVMDGDMSDQRRAAFEDVVAMRRSVRGFSTRPVPSVILDHIFTLAQFAPSNCNVQPWAVHVVSGHSTARLRNALIAAAETDAPASPDIELTPPYPGAYRDRQIAAAKALFAATGVAREDVAARRGSFLRNFGFFGAPHAALIFLPPWAGMREAADCGMYAQTLMLAMTSLGLASCAQGTLSHYADVVHRELGIGPELRLLFGISFGYEDLEEPANRTRTERVGVDQAVVFHP